MPADHQFGQSDYEHPAAIMPAEDGPDRGKPQRPLLSLQLPAQPYALPAQPTPLVGRDALLTRLAARLDTAETRLLTLVGAGGVGKTRLACELARLRERQHDVVRFIDLTQLQSGDDIAALVQDALGQIRLVNQQRSEPTVVRGLPRTLLVLDNFEHVIDAAPIAAELLSDASWLQIIATSRTPLRLRWEHISVVPPLKIPSESESSDPHELAMIPSVALFLTFVRRLHPEFAVTDENARVIAEICRRLDGLPLALELAAADLRVIGLDRLLERVDRPLTTLVNGPRDMPDRQQTLHATIEWSYALLSADEQRVAHQLAIFAGSATVSAVTEILQIPVDTAYNLIVNLAEQNLVDIVDENQVDLRFQMQHLVRDYLTEKLITDPQRIPQRDRFVAYYTRLATRETTRLTDAGADAAIETLSREFVNFRTILALAEEQRYIGAALELALTLMPLWEAPGRLSEGRRQLERIVTLATDEHRPRRIAVRVAAARLAVRAGELNVAQRLLDDARLDGDPLTLTPAGSTIACWECYIRLLRGDPDGAAALLDASPELGGANATVPGDIRPIFLRALIAAERGDGRAGDLLAEALLACGQAEDHAYAIEILCTQADMALMNSDASSAAQLFAEALIRAQVARANRSRPRALIGLGDIAADQLTIDGALRHYHAAFVIASNHQDERAMIRVLERVAVLGVTSRIYPNLLRMMGLADRMRARLDVGRSVFDERRIDPKMRHARSLLGDEEFNRIHADGQHLSLAEIIHELEHGPGARRTAVQTTPARMKHPPATIEQLTRREREVVQQISKGHTNRQIAVNLGMAERTVDSHIANVRQKLQLPSRARIAIWAVANGLSSVEHADAAN